MRKQIRGPGGRTRDHRPIIVKLLFLTIELLIFIFFSINSRSLLFKQISPYIHPNKFFTSHINYSLQVKCCRSQQPQFMPDIIVLSNSKEYNLLINRNVY